MLSYGEETWVKWLNSVGSCLTVVGFLSLVGFLTTTSHRFCSETPSKQLYTSLKFQVFTISSNKIRGKFWELSPHTVMSDIQKVDTHRVQCPSIKIDGLKDLVMCSNIIGIVR